MRNSSDQKDLSCCVARQEVFTVVTLQFAVSDVQLTSIKRRIFLLVQMSPLLIKLRSEKKKVLHLIPVIL